MTASALVSSVLPTPVGPRNRNEPMGRFGSCKPGARAAHRVGDGAHRFVLADDARFERVLPCAAASRARLRASCRPECRSSARRSARCSPASPPRSRARPCSSPRSSSSLLLEIGDDAIGEFARRAKSPLALGDVDFLRARGRAVPSGSARSGRISFLPASWR